MFDRLAPDRDNHYLMIDSSILLAHQQAATGRAGARYSPSYTAIYKHRNQVERYFGRCKHPRRLPTRYHVHFTDFVHLAATMIWLH